MLLIKGMSNIYFKVTIEKNCRAQNFCTLKIRDLGAKTVNGFSIHSPQRGVNRPPSPLTPHFKIIPPFLKILASIVLYLDYLLNFSFYHSFNEVR